MTDRSVFWISRPLACAGQIAFLVGTIATAADNDSISRQLAKCFAPTDFLLVLSLSRRKPHDSADLVDRINFYYQ
jgi:hypothetical protein